MRVSEIFISETAVVDFQENSLSIINVIEDFVASAFPIFLPKVTVTTIVVKEPADPDPIESFIIFQINGQEFQRSPVQIPFRGNNKARSILRISGFVIPQPGVLRISFEAGGTVQKFIELNAELQQHTRVDNR